MLKKCKWERSWYQRRQFSPMESLRRLEIGFGILRVSYVLCCAGVRTSSSISIKCIVIMLFALRSICIVLRFRHFTQSLSRLILTLLLYNYDYIAINCALRMSALQFGLELAPCGPDILHYEVPCLLGHSQTILEAGHQRQPQHHLPSRTGAIRMDDCHLSLHPCSARSGRYLALPTALRPCTYTDLAMLELEARTPYPGWTKPDVVRDDFYILPASPVWAGEQRIEFVACFENPFGFTEGGERRVIVLDVCAAEDDVAFSSWSRNDVSWFR
jgi:hypothetical protein